MNLTIAYRDSPLEDALLRDVSTYIVEREILIVLFNDGSRRNYPLANIRWFGEITETPDATTFVGFTDPNDSILPALHDLRCGGFKAPIVGCFCETCETARRL